MTHIFSEAESISSIINFLKSCTKIEQKCEVFLEPTSWNKLLLSLLTSHREASIAYNSVFWDTDDKPSEGVIAIIILTSQGLALSRFSANICLVDITYREGGDIQE